MNGLTKKDWVEIYYALVDKQARIDGEFGKDQIPENDDKEAAEWSGHLGTIIDKIGPDGENMKGG